MKNRFYTQPENTNKPAINDCKILILGETHTETHIIDLIKCISRYLREITDDPITFALEQPKKFSKEQTEENYQHATDAFQSLAQNCLGEIKDLQTDIEDLEKLKSQLSDDDENAKQKLTNLIAKWSIQLDSQRDQFSDYVGHAVNCQSHADFLSSLEDLKIGYAGIDINEKRTMDQTLSEESINARDKHMAKQIIPLLANNKVLIVRIGKAHTPGIIANLIASGVKSDNIMGFVAVDKKSLDEAEERLSIYKEELSRNIISQDIFDKQVSRLLPTLKTDAHSAQVTPIYLPDDTNEATYVSEAKTLVDNIFPSNHQHKI